MSNLQKNTDYLQLLEQIGKVYQSAKNKAVTAVNTEILNAYWEIGKRVVEFEQGGKIKAEYGRGLLFALTKDLKVRFGKGFSRSNLYQMRQLYIKYPDIQSVSGSLSWSHYVELLNMSDDLERSFYERQILIENWSVRELKRH